MRISALCIAATFTPLALAAGGGGGTPCDDSETSGIASFSREAASLVTREGEAAFPRFYEAPWLEGDRYVFILDRAGVMRVHPANPELVGVSQLDLVDVDGRPFIREFLAVTAGGGAGWVRYKWPEPGSTEPRWKASYVVGATAPSGVDYVIGSGIYEACGTAPTP